MAAVTIYTRPMCPYCVRAVSLLKKKGVSFDEIDAGFDVKKKKEMVDRANGARTFPQIFIGDTVAVIIDSIAHFFGIWIDRGVVIIAVATNGGCG